MSDIGISPEDRERLAKTKFGEWFDEFFDKKFEEAFDRKAATRPRPRAEAVPTDPDAPDQPKPPEPPKPAGRKRSLLEMALSQTFGF